jgi:hypothetical protein
VRFNEGVYLSAMKNLTVAICYVQTRALSRFHTALVKGMPFGACHGRKPQPVLTCASVVAQLVTSVDGEFDRNRPDAACTVFELLMMSGKTARNM